MPTFFVNGKLYSIVDKAALTLYSNAMATLKIEGMTYWNNVSPLSERETRAFYAKPITAGKTILNNNFETIYDMYYHLTAVSNPRDPFLMKVSSKKMRVLSSFADSSF